MLLHQLERFRRIEVADDRSRRVIRPIKRVVELLQLLDRHILDVAPPTDRRVMIRMRDVRGREDLLLQRLRRLVLADLKFIPHHRHLRLPVRVAQPKISHPIRFHRHVAVEMFAADVRVVVRAIEPRRRVVNAADPFQQLIDARAFLAIELRRALEHQMLEQVRRARRAGDFVSRSDAIRHHERQRRARVIGLHQHLQPVAVEPVLGNIADRFHKRESRNLYRVRRRTRRGGVARQVARRAKQTRWRNFMIGSR